MNNSIDNYVERLYTHILTSNTIQLQPTITKEELSKYVNAMIDEYQYDLTWLDENVENVANTYIVSRNLALTLNKVK